jgi:hypothetical protein
VISFGSAEAVGLGVGSVRVAETSRSAAEAPRAGRRIAWRSLIATVIGATVLFTPALLGSPARLTPAGAVAGASVMPLQEFTNNGANGRVWNAYDATTGASGPTISGRPSGVQVGSTEEVFARSAAEDLVEYLNNGGSAWSVADLTSAVGGPQIAGSPTAVVAGSNVDVFAREPSGDLAEFVGTTTSGQQWIADDLSSLPGIGVIQGNVSALVVGTTVDVFADAADGHLVEFTGVGSGTGTWSVTDLTNVAAGPTLGGFPSSVLYGSSSIHVYAVSSAGQLYEFVNDGAAGRAWNAYDLTTIAAGPIGAGTPSAVVYGPTVHVYLDAAGQLYEFVNDGFYHRLWNAYDLTAAAQAEAITGDPSAVTYGPVLVEIYAMGASGDLLNYVNDGAGGRLWNAYGLSIAAAGPTIGADPSVLKSGNDLFVYAAGPSPPAVVQAIVAGAESQDQDNLAVVENPPGSNCNIYTAYWGRGSTTGCAPGNSAEEWCSDFAQWVWAKAGIDTAGINGWSYTWVDWGQAHAGAWLPGDDDDPQPGDAVVWGDTSSAYGAHVGIVVGVSQGLIDVVSGNSGPAIDAQGDVDAVWDSGYFDPTTSTVDGYPIIGYVAPTGWTEFTANGHRAEIPAGALAHLIASQDGGK